METPIKDPTIHKDLGKLALEIWKVEKRLHKLDQKLSEDDKKGFSFLMERIYSALEKYGIHITDNTGQKYIEGMNGIDVVSVEAQEGLEQVI
ncbi:MAG: hypothetical protein LBP53_04855 [Candidatus Peribacteria bacterium]|nr:hypothetical protein [Candidatus Peribacteria bacterium]